MCRKILEMLGNTISNDETTSGRGKHKKVVVESCLRDLGSPHESTIDEVISEKVLEDRTCIKVFMLVWHKV
jgi:hypothetical protein